MSTPLALQPGLPGLITGSKVYDGYHRLLIGLSGAGHDTANAGGCVLRLRIHSGGFVDFSAFAAPSPSQHLRLRISADGLATMRNVDRS